MKFFIVLSLLFVSHFSALALEAPSLYCIEIPSERTFQSAGLIDWYHAQLKIFFTKQPQAENLFYVTKIGAVNSVSVYYHELENAVFSIPEFEGLVKKMCEEKSGSICVMNTDYSFTFFEKIYLEQDILMIQYYHRCARPLPQS